MPLVILKTGVGAVPALTTGTSLELLQFSPFQHVPFHAECRFGMNSDVGPVLATVYAGTDLLLAEGPIAIAGANVYPKFPDDFHLVDKLAAGARLTVLLRNLNAGTAVANLFLHIDPI